MYSHCAYKITASGNNSHSEPANCPNFINAKLDPRSPCSNSLAWLLHHGLWGMDRSEATTMAIEAAAGVESPVTQHVEPGPCFPSEVSKSSHRSWGPFREWRYHEWDSQYKLPGFLLGSTEGWKAPRNTTNHPVQLPAELTPLISLQTLEVNHIAKTGCMYHDSHLCTWVQHWSSWVRSASLSSPHCTPEITKDMHRNAMSHLLGLSFLSSVRRMWNKWVLDLKFWNFWVIGDLCKFITGKSQTLPDITFGGCLLLI